MKTNLLIMDEVMDGAADQFLQQELVHLLNDMKGTNFFVICDIDREPISPLKFFFCPR